MAGGAPSALEQELEELSCPVCMDVFHKPCFTPCAHAFCFWCMHRSMSHGWQPESKCPYCRQPFGRFPAVCEALHHYVRWRFPAEAAAKEANVKEFERSTGNTSYDIPALPPTAEGLPASLFGCVACGEVSAGAALLGCGHLTCGRPACAGAACARCGGRNASRPHRSPLLKQLIARLAPAAQQPAEASQAAASASAAAEDSGEREATAQDSEPVHFGVGCDGLSCGQLPIRGRRYRCLDCPEAMGFDLCGPCYDHSLASAQLPGKFGQHHTREHRMELVRPQQMTIGQIAELVGQREMAPGEAVAGLQRLVDALEAEQHVARLRALSRAEQRAQQQQQQAALQRAHGQVGQAFAGGQQQAQQQQQQQQQAEPEEQRFGLAEVPAAPPQPPPFRHWLDEPEWEVPEGVVPSASDMWPGPAPPQHPAAQRLEQVLLAPLDLRLGALPQQQQGEQQQPPPPQQQQQPQQQQPQPQERGQEQQRQPE